MTHDEGRPLPDAVAASSRFFEDRHIDAQLRALVPQFARYTVAVIVLSAPFMAPTWERGVGLAADGLIALLVNEAVARGEFLLRARIWQVFVLLTTYVAFIAAAAGLSGTVLPYGLLQLLPVTFAAVFFRTGWWRYLLAVVAAVLEYAAVRPLHGEQVKVAVLRGVCYLLVAHFGVALSRLVREALQSHRSLHSVLEMATAGASEERLAQGGLVAGLSVIAWEAGAVALTSGPADIRVAAIAGVGEAVRAHYHDAPLRRGDGGLASEVIRLGTIQQIDDLRSVLPADHVLLAEGFHSMAGTPIPYQGETIGVLVTFHRHARRLDERERDRLRGVAEQLGLALGSARAHRREVEVAESLRELNERKDAFLAAVSHELRTPAATIELGARTLQRGLGRLGPAERQRIVDALVNRGRDLRELIEALLDVALTESGESRLLLEPVQWVVCLQRWTAELEERLGRRIVLDAPDEDVVSLADPAKVERILFALVSNAVKFSFDEQPVVVRLSFTHTDVVLAVQDEGMGILPGDVERIFDRFLQLDGSSTRSAGGLGIGLTLVRHFTGLHGGRIEVDSEVGKGSTFTVTIPLDRWD